MSRNNRKTVVLLGTGGTIAGLAANAADNVGYTAAQVGVEQLVGLLPSGVLSRLEVMAEQVAQLDSKDMGFPVWHLLARRCLHFLARPDVQGIVVTHGTDTLEETAFFLQAVLSGAAAKTKPVVLTGAMRPASSFAADGPQNMVDALCVASQGGLSGVLVVIAGSVHSAVDVQKAHTYRLDAFDSGDAGPLGYVEEGTVRVVRQWSWARAATCLGTRWGGSGIARLSDLEAHMASPTARWPRVEIIMNCAGVDQFVVDSLLSHGVAREDPVRGIVVAGTGNGTLHRDLEVALLRAQSAGVLVVRATRCPRGRVLANAGDVLPDSGGLSPVKARIAMMLGLMHRNLAANSAADGKVRIR